LLTCATERRIQVADESGRNKKIDQHTCRPSGGAASADRAASRARDLETATRATGGSGIQVLEEVARLDAQRVRLSGAAQDFFAGLKAT
jgi:hypothetical protein